MQRPGEETLIRYFRGQCPPEEAKAVEAYLAMNTDHDYVTACLQESFTGPYQHIAADELDHLYARLGKKQEYKPVIHKRRFGYAAAAAIALLVTISVVFYKGGNPLRHAAPVQTTWHKIAATSVRNVRLPDSSMITLFPGSAIEISGSFNGSDRHVRLSGRAFFSVTRNPSKPFLVTSNSLTTKVLGTSFEINAMSANSEDRITLYTGRIRIAHNQKEIALLKPGQQLHFNKASQKYGTGQAEVSGAPSWIRGEFSYDQVSLSEILQDLAAWHQIKIAGTGTALPDQKITVSFQNLSLNDVLNMLSKSAGFNWQKHGNQITIKKGGE